jgi:hypothetical protein
MGLSNCTLRPCIPRYGNVRPHTSLTASRMLCNSAIAFVFAVTVHLKISLSHLLLQKFNNDAILKFVGRPERKRPLIRPRRR